MKHKLFDQTDAELQLGVYFAITNFVRNLINVRGTVLPLIITAL